LGHFLEFKILLEMIISDCITV